MNSFCISKRFSTNIFKILFTILLVIMLLPNSFADEIDYSQGSSELSSKPSVFDSAKIIDNDTKLKLEDISQKAKEKYNADVVFVSVKTLSERTATEYADDFFYKNGYGEDNNRNGLVFLIAVDERKWAISTNGDTIRAFTDAGQEYIMEGVLPYLKKDNYSGAFSEFGNYVLNFYEKAAQGKPYDYSNLPKKERSKAISFLYAIIFSIIPTAVIVIILVGQMKNVRHKTTAEQYVKKDKSSARVIGENYIRSSLVSHKRSDSDSGSSTHTNSSGGISGGSSGSF